MKRTITRITYILLLISLVSVPSLFAVDEPLFDFSAFFEGTNKNNIDQSYLGYIKEAAKEEGVDISWDAQGNMTMKDSESTVSISNKWPKNEFTRLIPTPGEGSVGMTEVNPSGCTIVMTWTMEQARKYASQVKAKGFNKNVDEQDISFLNMYCYSANNASGHTVEILYFAGVGSIGITKE